MAKVVFSRNTVEGECASYIQCPPSLSLALSLCCTCCRFSLHTFVHTCTRSHNGGSKFFQGISRLINRLVVWGSSEVQRSRLNPLTGRIISGRWVHTSPVAPRGPPAPSSLLTQRNGRPTDTSLSTPAARFTHLNEGGDADGVSGTSRRTGPPPRQ